MLAVVPAQTQFLTSVSCSGGNTCQQLTEQPSRVSEQSRAMLDLPCAGHDPGPGRGLAAPLTSLLAPHVPHAQHPAAAGARRAQLLLHVLLIGDTHFLLRGSLF